MGNILKTSLRVTGGMIMIAINLLAAVVVIFSAYGGAVNPEKFVIAAIAAMAFPYALLGSALLLVVDFLIFRKSTLIILATWLICLPSILTLSPIHLPKGKLSEEEQARSFTFLTYNVLHFWDFRGQVDGLERNATIDYILRTDADIVNLQEVEFIKEWPLWHITTEQISELSEKYPYRSININKQQTLLSKYPFEEVPLENVDPVVKQHMALFRMNINGHITHILNVHLKSIGLTPRDKELYMNLFEKAPGSEAALREEFDKVKSQLLSKLADAFRERSEQAAYIRQLVDSIGGNFIVAGDFNDVPGCYAIRTIQKAGMTDAYRHAGIGPVITYHGNRFYFRIDHVLYRGDMDAVKVRREPNPSSDHYPLLTTFIWKQTP